jgi:pimeloyl-ACP methyl ester carboxylesterase
LRYGYVVKGASNKLMLQAGDTLVTCMSLQSLQAPQDLSILNHPVLIVNGEDDKMVPISNSYELKKRIKNSEIIVYKDAGHGGIFQYHEEFVKVH